jgi:hypothetical protein
MDSMQNNEFIYLGAKIIKYDRDLHFEMYRKPKRPKIFLIPEKEFHRKAIKFRPLWANFTSVITIHQPQKH